jgi:hypothetical protein
MIGVILGNGPSKSAYDRTGDFVLGCNIPGDQFSVDATVICDEEIVWVLKNDLTLVQVPVIISTKVYEKMKELGIVNNFIIHHVFKPKDWHNAAHYAADFLIENRCDEIHLWGCDSIFENTVVSSTAEYTNQNTVGDDRFVKNWRRVWHDKMKIGNEDDVHFVVYRMTK